MTKYERERWARFVSAAFKLGLGFEDIEQLRRDALRLARFAENECNGDIQRDENGQVFRHYGHNGPGPFLTVKARDTETPAKARITETLKAKGLRPYFQGDPRGEPVYILSPGMDDDDYTRGLCVPTFR